MNKSRKRNLSMLIILFFLSSMFTFNVSAVEESLPTTLTKVSQVAGVVTGEGSDITITTANIFGIGNYYSQTKVLFEVSGLDFSNNQSYYAIFEDNQTQWITKKTDTMGFFTRYINNAPEGNVDFTITIQDSYNNPTLVYNPVNLSTYLKASFPVTLTDLNKEMQTVSHTNLNPYVMVDVPAEYNTENITMKLLSSTGEVFAASSSVQNKPYSYNTTTYDLRYNSIYSVAPEYELICSLKALNASLYCGKPLKEDIYDVNVYDNLGNILYTVQDAVKVTAKPYVTFYSDPSEFPRLEIGSTEIYGYLRVEGGDINDYNLGLYDSNDFLIARSNGQYKVQNAYGQSISAVYKLTPESGKSITEGTYTLKVITDVDYVTDSSTKITVSNSSNSKRIYSVIVPNSRLANVIVFGGGFDSGKQYKAVLQQGNEVIAEQLAMPFNNTFDIEFTNSSGDVISLDNHSGYNIFIKDKDYNGDWESYGTSGNFYTNYYEEITENPNPIYTYGYTNFSEGSLVANIAIENAAAINMTDINNFKIIAASTIGEEYVYDRLEVNKSLHDRNTTFNLKQPVLEAMQKGNYTFKAYYNNEEILNGNKNILDQGYSARYDDIPSVGNFASMRNNLQCIIGFSINEIENIINPQLKLYSIDNLTVTPDYTIDLVSENGQYEIKASQAAGVNFFRKYCGVIYVDGKPIGSAGDNQYFAPADMAEDVSTYNITVVQGEHGTLTASVTSGTKGTEVYLKNSPDSGYQFKPGSLKVNGITVLGRSFILTENAVVTAEFEPVFVQKYLIEKYPYIYNGSISIDKTQAAEGETVTITATPDTQYKLTELKYRTVNNYNYVNIDLATKTFIMPAKDIVVDARFSYAQSYYISFPYYEGGNISTVNNNYYATEGNTVDLLIIPWQGYRLKKDSLYYQNNNTGESVAINGSSFAMPQSSVIIYAEFEQAPTYTVMPSTEIQNGTIAVNPVGNVVAGQEVSVSAVPKEGYKLSSLSYKINGQVESVEIQNNKFIMPEGNVTIYAVFELIPLVPHSITIAPMEKGTVTVSKSNALRNEWIVITVTPDEGYRIKEGTLKANQLMIPIPATTPPAVIGFIMPDEEVVITAEFELIPKIQLFKQNKLNINKNRWDLQLIIPQELQGLVDSLDRNSSYITTTIKDENSQTVLENIKTSYNNTGYYQLYKTEAIAAGNYTAEVTLRDYDSTIYLGKTDISFGDFVGVKGIYVPDYYNEFTTATRNFTVEVNLDQLFSDLPNFEAALVDKATNQVIATAKTKNYRHYDEANKTAASEQFIKEASTTLAFHFELEDALDVTKVYAITFDYSRDVVLEGWIENSYRVTANPKIMQGQILDNGTITFKTECVPAGSYNIEYYQNTQLINYTLVVDEAGNAVMDVSANRINSMSANFSVQIGNYYTWFYAYNNSSEVTAYPRITIEGSVPYNAQDWVTKQYVDYALPLGNNITFTIKDYTGQGKVELVEILASGQEKILQTKEISTLVNGSGSFEYPFNAKTVYSIRAVGNSSGAMTRFMMMNFPFISIAAKDVIGFYGDTLTIPSNGAFNITDFSKIKFYLNSTEIPVISINSKEIKLDMTNAPYVSPGIYTLLAKHTDYLDGLAYDVITPIPMKFYKIGDNSPVIISTGIEKTAYFAEGLNMDKAYAPIARIFKVENQSLTLVKEESLVVASNTRLELSRNALTGLQDGTYAVFYVVNGTDKACQTIDYIANEYFTDINNDSVVNLQDLEIVASHYGSTPEAADWNTDADINNDGVIDIFDIVITSTEME